MVRRSSPRPLNCVRSTLLGFYNHSFLATKQPLSRDHGFSFQSKRLSNPTVDKRGSIEMAPFRRSEACLFSDLYTNLTPVFLIVLIGASNTAKFGMNLWYKLTTLLTLQ
jgi:hypothetical protein